MAKSVANVMMKSLKPTTTSPCDMQSGGKPCCADNMYGRAQGGVANGGTCPTTRMHSGSFSTSYSSGSGGGGGAGGGGHSAENRRAGDLFMRSMGRK